MSRFKVIEGSQHWCCFSYSVVDSNNKEGGTFQTICECFNQQDASMIAYALNQWGKDP